MPKPAPYQPLIFRLLHAAHGGLILGSMLTGFWLYNTWDGRFGKLAFPQAEEKWLNIHHQIGEILTAVFLVFLLYSLVAGQRRLTNPSALLGLRKLKLKQRWFTLHRLINTCLLSVVFLAMVSSRLMGGAKTILQNEWNDLWYNLHILSWSLLIILVALHLLLMLQVGGLPFTLSAIALKVTQEDSPSLWPKRFSNWIRRIINS